MPRRNYLLRVPRSLAKQSWTSLDGIALDRSAACHSLVRTLRSRVERFGLVKATRNEPDLCFETRAFPLRAAHEMDSEAAPKSTYHPARRLGAFEGVRNTYEFFFTSGCLSQFLISSNPLHPLDTPAIWQIKFSRLMHRISILQVSTQAGLCLRNSGRIHGHKPRLQSI